MRKSASARWQGSLKEGKDTISAESGALKASLDWPSQSQAHRKTRAVFNRAGFSMSGWRPGNRKNS
ncbi:hypothetical protein [Halopseudomonas maritima]|uniref:hypothetical protein n=1 Tax=Halopseudomonas maritima TaxID=2918528 RepID=UPI0037BF7D40